MAIDCVTATKGWSRPKAGIQASGRERPLPDRKADIATKRLSCIAASLVATTAWTDVLSLLGFTSNLKDPVVENTELVGLERVSTE